MCKYGYVSVLIFVSRFYVLGGFVFSFGFLAYTSEFCMLFRYFCHLRFLVFLIGYFCIYVYIYDKLICFSCFDFLDTVSECSPFRLLLSCLRTWLDFGVVLCLVGFGNS